MYFSKRFTLLKLVVPFPKAQGHATFKFHLGHVKEAKGNSEDYIDSFSATSKLVSNMFSGFVSSLEETE